jgi:hypothetical protein
MNSENTVYSDASSTPQAGVSLTFRKVWYFSIAQLRTDQRRVSAMEFVWWLIRYFSNFNNVCLINQCNGAVMGEFLIGQDVTRFVFWIVNYKKESFRLKEG